MSFTQPLYYPFGHRRDIRLLRIKSERGRNNIETDLEVFKLDSNVQYTALSYVWGNPLPSSWIVCNGHSVAITRNLWEVLSCLQEQECRSLLWVDAICINRQDNEEKSIQVNMMRDIYKRAANVLFWLGQEEQYDKAAVRLMDAFVENHKIHSDLEPLRGKSLNELGLPSNDCGWVGWASLLSRPWFGRVWVVQEFLNATRSVFMSGALEIPSDLLVWIAYATGACGTIGQIVALYNISIRKNRALVLRPFALGLDMRVRAIEGDGDTRIVDLWTRSQLLEATDPRDRVFALLSTQTAVSMDMVDYDKDVETVYTEIASIALTIQVSQTEWYKTTPCDPRRNPSTKRMERTSRFMACKTITSHLPSLPSWVPDWRPAEFRFVPLTRYFPGTAWFTHDYSHAIIHGKVLFISGYIVDRPSIIVESTPYMEAEQPGVLLSDSSKYQISHSWLKKLIDWQIMCYLLAESYTSRLKKHQFLEDFCRTMAFNALPNRGTAPGVQYTAGFRALHSQLSNASPGTVKYSLAFPRSYTPADQNVIYESVFLELSAGRKFVITAKKDLAWVPSATKLGDRICFLAGCAVPFVIRPIGKSFELLGDCYLHSMMEDNSIILHTQPQQLEFR